MFTRQDTYAAFFHLLEAPSRPDAPEERFPEICRRLGVRPRRFDRFLQRELGFRGEEIVRIYRDRGHKKD